MNDTPLSVRFAEKAADLAALEAAALDVAETLTYDGLSTNIWTSMTCEEVEKVAHLFRLAGDEDAAKRAIKMHANGDDEGDDHYEEPVFLVTIAVRAPNHDNPDVSRIVSEYLQVVNSPVFECDLLSVDTKEAE